MAPKTASTWLATRWACSPKWSRSTWRKSWTSGPKCTASHFCHNGEKHSNFVWWSLFVRGVHGHMQGSRPWAWAENNLEVLMARVVGNTTEYAIQLNWVCHHKVSIGKVSAGAHFLHVFVVQWVQYGQLNVTFQIPTYLSCVYSNATSTKKKLSLDLDLLRLPVKWPLNCLCAVCVCVLFFSQERVQKRLRWWTGWRSTYTCWWCKSRQIHWCKTRELASHIWLCFGSFPSTNPRLRGTRYFWKTKPSLRTMWVTLIVRVIHMTAWPDWHHATTLSLVSTLPNLRSDYEDLTLSRACCCWSPDR